MAFVGMVLENPEIVVNMKAQYPKRVWFQDKELGKIAEALQNSDDKDLKTIADVTGLPTSRVLQIQLDAPVSANIDPYAKEIADKFKLRTIVDIGQKWIRNAALGKDFQQEVNADMDLIQRTASGEQELVLVDEAIDGFMEELQGKIAGTIRPMATGFPSLDDSFAGGLHAELVTIAGRPGTGKSALIKSMIIKNLKAKLKVAIFSVEMTVNEYLARMVSEWCGIDGKRIKKGHVLNDEELDKIHGFRKEIKESKFSFNKIQECTVLDVARLSKSAKISNGGVFLKCFRNRLAVSKSLSSWEIARTTVSRLVNCLYFFCN